jgi:hypothetical protein
LTVFTAMHGAVFFEGRPVSEYRAIAVRQHLVARALDHSVSETVANAFWSIRDQLVAALTASRDQRRIINTVCSTIAAERPTALVDHSHSVAACADGRESQA